MRLALILCFAPPGFMEIFFAKMGITGLRFKPAYNPYTEVRHPSCCSFLPCFLTLPVHSQPSLEIFSYHEGLKKWVEIGNSGMFRPEMLEPMGLPPDVRVHGWGLSLERPTMIRYGISNIRDLLGHKVSSHFCWVILRFLAETERKGGPGSS